MPLSTLNSLYFKSILDRHEQGDILRDVQFIEWAKLDESGSIEVAQRILPYAVLLSQDCDLEHDYDNRLDKNSPIKDKYLQSLLLCPAYPAQSFREGKHLEKMGMVMRPITTDPWKRLIQLNDARYHYLEGKLDLQVPELVIDFKHYLTVPRDIIYGSNCYIATIEIVYRDHLSSRFANYLSRIGLPDRATA
jgi:hypothetical protein